MRVFKEWLMTPQRCAVHVPTATAVVADLHLGYNEARCRFGDSVPYGNLETLLSPLAQAFSAHDIRRLVIAGDLFEAAYCETLAGQLLRWLKTVHVELTAVIPGNHDRGLREAASQLPVYAEGYRLGGWQVAHGDGKLPRSKSIHGHFHPCLRLGRIATPCFLVGSRRILLPAYSADARGVNVLGVTAWRRDRCCIPVGDKVLDFGEVATLRRISSLGGGASAPPESSDALSGGRQPPES